MKSRQSKQSSSCLKYHASKDIFAKAFLALLTFFLSFYNFANEGFSNLYYSAALKSMSESSHNFFFLSFDPGGFVSVDKPPVALWIEAVFVKLFGFHSWSILLPSALASCAAVLLLFSMVRRRFGLLAGVSAGLALAVTPIFIAASCSNNPDAILLIVLLIAAWAALQAAETGRLRYLLLTAVMIGLGFNTKMLVAYLVFPACLVVYALSRHIKLRDKLIHIPIAIVLLACVSFSWVAAVDLTPAEDRPFVGSSSNNSEMNLTFGYNGLNRVFASDAARKSEPASTADRHVPNETDTVRSQAPPGPLRLLDEYDGQQIGWFLPFALVGTLASLIYLRKQEGEEATKKKASLLFWTAWTITMGAFFSSYHDLTHRYYLNIIAPGAAALCGIGFKSMLRLVQSSNRWKSMLLPAGLLIGVGYEVYLLAFYPDWLLHLAFFLAVAGILAVVLIVLILSRRPKNTKVIAVGASAALLCLFVAPFFWSFTAVLGHVSGGDAAAGPSLLSSRNYFPSFSSVTQGLQLKTTDPASSRYRNLEQYLEQHQDGAEDLAAVPGASSAESLIIDTGKPIMAIGGFSGSNRILTLQKFQELVNKGKVKYFLVDNSTAETAEPPDSSEQLKESIVRGGKTEAVSDVSRQYGNNAQIINWVLQNWIKVNPALYQNAGKGTASVGVLYMAPNMQNS